MKLSIIIPAYNAEPYLSELYDRLSPQIAPKEVEVLIIDDGSRTPVSAEYKCKWCQVIRQKNRGVSAARNTGIDKAKGDYISFIDADDLVSEHFVDKILEKTKEEPDIIELSWKSLTKNNWNIDAKLHSDQERLSNPSVCTRVFKRSFIGDIRFNVHKDSTEDEDFSRKVGYYIPVGDRPLRDNKTVVITDYMYFYRDDVPMSKTKRYAAGLMNTKKVIYSYEQVTDDMDWLLEEIRQQDEVNEVFLQTYKCDIPELKRYCKISKPHQDWGHILKGQPSAFLTLKQPPLKTQVVIYRKTFPAVGGIGTFVNNFIDQFADKYDIVILCRSIYCRLYEEYVSKVRVIADTIRLPSGRLMQLSGDKGSSQTIACDTLIVPSFLDPLPGNVAAGQVVRMCHACKTDSSWEIPKDYDELIYVSETAMRSYGEEDGKVIHNLCNPPKDKALMLVSATRFPAPDKGDIEKRMRTLAKMLNDKGLSYIWLNFSDGKMDDPPKNFYNMGPSDRMPEIIRAADYLVQLSDSECWSYACLEALTAGTPLICTPFPSIYEMGVKDKVHAHIIPFDMDFDVEILKKVPHFYYTYDNDTIAGQWREILPDTKPKHDYKPMEYVMTEVVMAYYDMELEREMRPGEELMVRMDRAQKLKALRYIKITGG